MKPKHTTTIPLAGFAAAILLASAANSQAALLVYEGFNGYSNNAAIGGVAANGNTVGLTGNYTASSAYTTTSTGLTFGSGATTLSTTGGALSISSSASDVLNVTLDLTSSFVGTLYSAHLVNYSNHHTSALNTLGGPELGVAGGGSDHFQTAADDFFTGGSANNAGIAYKESPSNSNTALPDNQTFLVLGRFTRVGETMTNGDAVSEMATLWILSSAQFDNFAAGGLTDAELDGASQGTGSTAVYAKATSSFNGGGSWNVFRDNDVIDLLVSGGATTDTINVTFDEMRWADSLNSVAPIPEPSAFVMLLCGLGTLALRRRRA